MNRKLILPVFLIFQIVLVKTLGLFPHFIENGYSKGLYPKIAWFSRKLLGSIPFSVGDIIYILLIVGLLRWIWCNRKGFFKNWKNNGLTLLSWISIFYFCFHLFWGMNYYRIPIAQKLALEKEYSGEDLAAFTEKMVAQTNALQLRLAGNETIAVVVPYSEDELFNLAQQGYDQLPPDLSDFHYENKSIKASLLRLPLSYMGFGGYLNPFTNEAQVNTLKPKFSTPLTVCHEMAHQTGIGSESECNFIGFIAASRNKDLYFQYSAYSFITRYCLHHLERMKKGEGKKYFDRLNKGVIKNFQEHEMFWKHYHTPIDSFFEFFYDNFLKANQQQDGIASYSKFVGLMIHYDRIAK
ncbi:DUF3810 domain-containing protein [Flavobacterium sp. NRK F10]|uniref:DUF3810 domain-containing protein n=1 Tax=Flavobacterium sp. NRK F10 TaxID=2954931 RepID=UPI0020910418|nr:DUF3810 domain-containing protein [Flavobacterium sp. NRK F10]MCO6173875.1 DUF3810 domain-containing protein [Flavobacterium sp. NRK F10]